MTRFEISDLLHQGLMGMDIDSEISEQAESQLIHYIELIAQWNRVYNLSSIRDLDTMVTRHLLDSLSILLHIEGKTILDVGTGAGLPGIPLEIAMPDRQFVVLDSNQKKTKFLQLICQQMCLNNVRVVHQRVEDYLVTPLFDTVISRAFGTIRDFLSLSKHLVKPSGHMIAMKGVYPLTELQEVCAQFRLVDTESLEIPGLNAERHIVEFIYLPETQQQTVGV